MNKAFGILMFTSLVILQRPVFAVDVAPRISDREIVEGLAEIRGDIKRLDAGISSLRSEVKGDIQRLEDGQKTMDKRIDDLRSDMNGKFADLRSEMNNRFDSLHWTLGIFITIALVILGFVLRMQWQMHQRQTRMETVLETQRDELSFIRKIIETFLPPRGVL